MFYTQIGINKRFFILNPNGKKNPNTGYLFINPSIISKSIRVHKLGEACLSLPKIEGSVERHYSIDVKSILINASDLETIHNNSNDSNNNYNQQMDINYKQFHLKEYSAQIFQHELDHLNGILFTDKLHYVSDKIKAKLKLKLLNNAYNKNSIKI